MKNTIKPEKPAGRPRLACPLKLASLLYFLLAILLMMGIWIFSSRSGTVSQVQSDSLLDLLHLPETPLASFIIRKMAHFSIYLVLGIAWLLFFSSLGWSRKKACLAALACCIHYAGIDEFHQTFIDGRSGEIRDVLLDGTGSLAGIGLCCLVAPVFQSLKARFSARK